MLAPMDSNTEKNSQVIHVKLLDELVPVWRPVKAEKNPDGSYLIALQEIPEFEEWEFLPGNNVITEERINEHGKYRVAIKLRGE